MKRFMWGMLFLFVQQFSWAQVRITVQTVDAEDGTPLSNASVQVKEVQTMQTNEEGLLFFSLKKPGTYRFFISAIGYQALQKEVTITSDTKKLDFELTRQQLFMQPIEISASRAGSKAPFAKTNLSKAEIEKRNLGQDIPFILNQTPSVVVTSDAGNGIGYTGIRIRGTDATRINMTINGIPYNDAESQGIFFVNLPDLASSVSSIQIQRGVGTSTNGAGAFGATMNFSINEFNEKAYAEVNNSLGSFATRKHTVKAGTGLINNHFTVDARLSRIESAGFVDRAATNLQSFYLSGAYVNKNTSIRLNIISGNEKTYQAWNGVPEAKLRNQPDQLLNHYYNNIGSLYFTKQDSINLFTSDQRRFNVYLYDNQTDNYRQDHYQFFVNHSFNSSLKANLTLFYSQGRGYYEQYRHNNRFSSYGLPNVVVGNTTVRRTDLIRQLWLDNDFYGGLYTLEYKKKKHSLIGGGGYTVYKGNHFGEIPWAAIGIAPRHRWYDFDATKTDFNLFAKWQYAITDALELFTDIQYRGVNYRFTGTRKFPTVNVNETFHFLNPKLGIHYRRNGYTAYASYAVGNKEPNRDDYERNETDPLPRREQLHNVEAGVSKNTSRYTWNANLFLMRYKDQLVLTGRINDVGDAVRVNVPNSYRLGIELQGTYRFNNWLEAEGNLTWSRNRILNFTDAVPRYNDWFELIGQDSTLYKNTPMSFSPEWISSTAIHAKPNKNITISLISKSVSDQFMDNTGNVNRKLEGYFIQDLRWIYSFRSKLFTKADLILQVNNIWNRKYEANGYTYSYLFAQQLVTENFFFPMAGTNFTAAFNIRF